MIRYVLFLVAGYDFCVLLVGDVGLVISVPLYILVQVEPKYFRKANDISDSSYLNVIRRR